jgi:hypothetical protein
MTRMLKEAILLAGENVGNQLAETAKEEQKGLVSLEWAAMKQPAAYLALLGCVMPMQVEATNKDADVPYKTVEELQQALRDRGQAFEAAGVEFIDANNGGAGLRLANARSDRK